MAENAGRIKGRGFTLIELLIVVAIIAILAAIAVPNFLEAQVRSKVARCKTDMRTVAVAIESYAVDWNRAPIGYHESKKWTPVGFGLQYEDEVWHALWRQMTSPVAYTSSIPIDPFMLKGRVERGTLILGDTTRYYWYQSVRMTSGQGTPLAGIYQQSAAKGISWCLSSIGPSRQRYVEGHGRQVAPTAAKILGWPETGNMLRWPNLVYDSTNGTISFGYLIRSNAGVL